MFHVEHCCGNRHKNRKYFASFPEWDAKDLSSVLDGPIGGCVVRARVERKMLWWVRGEIPREKILVGKFLIMKGRVEI